MSRQGYEFPIGWLAVTNGTSEPIPPYGVVRITSIDQSTGIPVVGKPDAEADNALFVNGGAPIPPGASGQVHCTFPAIVAVSADNDDGADPAHGEIWGPKADSWYLHRGYQGYVIQGVGRYGLANVIRQSSCYPYADNGVDGIVRGGGVGQRFGGNKSFGHGNLSVFIAIDDNFDPDNPTETSSDGGYTQFAPNGYWTQNYYTDPAADDYIRTTIDMDADALLGGSPPTISLRTEFVVSGSTTKFAFLEFGHDNNAVLRLTGDGAYPRFAIGANDGATSNVAGIVFIGGLATTVPANLTYTPAVAGDWNGAAPTTITGALDRCATLLKALNGGVGP